jgi:hypothetical protein
MCSEEIWLLALITLWDSLLSSPSSIAFFPSAFFAASFYRFASSCPELYSCNVFSVIVVVCIATSCTETASGGAFLGHLASLHGAKYGADAPGHF